MLYFILIVVATIYTTIPNTYTTFTTLNGIVIFLPGIIIIIKIKISAKH